MTEARILLVDDEPKLVRLVCEVLTADGIAILGYRVGDSLEWKVPEGVSRLKVKEILYQPEASGEEESGQVDFTSTDQTQWQNTLEKVMKSQEVFDDYTYP